MQKAASFTRSAFGHIHENIVEKKSERIEIRYQILHTHTQTRRTSRRAKKIHKWKNSMDDDWFMKVHHTIRNP